MFQRLRAQTLADELSPRQLTRLLRGLKAGGVHQDVAASVTRRKWMADSHNNITTVHLPEKW